MGQPTFEVILTHEHTDFDALASLLAASLLFPDALPVLPALLNRNVGEFLALYKNQFPFLAAKELPRGRILRAILVDARSVNLPKGAQGEMRFLVIDHHSGEVQASLGEGGGEVQLWSEPVGANTTLLVEKLREQNYALSSVQATLLALGIHEDTGSLTYGGTTYRDVRSLAWLMEPERGVNLDVLMQYLRHPLSEAQRTLLQILLEQSEFLEVAGHSVVIAQAEAPDFHDELSTLAHRLRDVHDTNALFLVVGLQDIVQVVARSTIDAVDVGALAKELGGGGHTRAAAASVHHATPQAVRDQIVALLQAKSQPAMTVRQLMSSGRPQMVSPEMTIDEASHLMRRYGHEGFPVVQQQPDGSEVLLGVLTRREADRVLNHGMGDARVRRFMQAGQVTVQPSDSLATLRKTMIESGWGQLPVVDEQGKIIGIVTRTDLIKLWDGATLPAQRADEIDQRLQTTLSPVQYALLRLIGKEVDAFAFAVYVVGGFARDLLLAHPSERVQTLDMDIVIEGDAIVFAQHLQARYGGRVVQHKTFGTAKWLLTDEEQPVRLAHLLTDLELAAYQETAATQLPAHLDFVTARTEFYTAPTVLPTVELSNIKLDLHRRDFTINTLAICLNLERWGELLDFYGGVNDLNEGVVRVLHSLSFVDDPTRILRAVRYEQRFHFQISSRTLELLHDALELLDRVTPVRIRHEFERILQEAMPENSLHRLAELQVLAQLHPSLQVDDWVQIQFERLRAIYAEPNTDALIRQTPIERLYWGLLVLRLPRDAQQLLQTRLGLRNETQMFMQDLRVLREHTPLLSQPTLRPSQAVEILDKLQPVAWALYIALDLAPTITPVLQQYATTWRHIRPALDGNDLAALGLPRGPLYRQILTALRTARLDGLLTTRIEEVALAQNLAQLKA